jgi:DNA repair exonuclease SbcCD ATPase subunit
MLIEMITPKVKEIEEKFGNGKALTQEDINTLLLKSQYNHINHLDSKLNEVTADVASLKGEFNGLKGEFNGLKNDLELKFKLLETSIKKDNELFKAEIKSEISDIKNEMKTFKKEIQLEISTAINSNMKWSIGLIALIVTALKVLDMFMQ